ncbi:TetR/AcrR family transcriptional regulator [Actinomadura viridis]|uniref:AcrR family transcriptional regulator n=1 Tax=Actinomadura viridis TaxID=58110 RepID=A0A931DFP3_9ACTN|nr:TetR/AcrR family transcriptional regulator [Actinomadura viridis]MBG6085913.1 AcrR family transcriptional regulator [Actinomadura viridis]
MARPPTPLRAQILESALGLFAARGFRGTSLQDIASEVGCSKASLLYHFTSKDAILSELLTPAGQALAELDERLSTLDPDEAVMAAVTGFIDLSVRFKREVKILFGEVLTLTGHLGLPLPEVTERLLDALTGNATAPRARVAAWMVIGGVFMTSATAVSVTDDVLRAEMVRGALRTLDHRTD